MITSWPYPGSDTVACSMGKHGRCKGNCSCDGHLQSPRLRRYGSRRPSGTTWHPSPRQLSVAPWAHTNEEPTNRPASPAASASGRWLRC